MNDTGSGKLHRQRAHETLWGSLKFSGAQWSSLGLSGAGLSGTLRQTLRAQTVLERDNGRSKARMNMANANTTTAEKLVHVIGSTGTGISLSTAVRQQGFSEEDLISSALTFLHSVLVTFLRIRLMYLWLAA